MRKHSTSKKLLTELRKNHKYCEFCGHTLTFFAFEPDRKLCKYCGKYNYRDEKAKFKDMLARKRREYE